MKYYAITKGTYSDYHIITITADKEKAKMIAKWHSDRYDDARVEEYEDNIEVQIPIWTVYIENGEFESCYVCGCPEEVEDELNEITDLNSYVYVRAKSEEQARKIAYDLIAEYKARNDGIS